MQSPKKRSLLGVNEHFEGEHTQKYTFYSASFVAGILLYTRKNYRHRELLIRTIALRDEVKTAVDPHVGAW